MTNLQAALGVAQLERLDEFIHIKRKVGNMYSELLADIKSLQLPLAKTDYAENIYWVYGVVLKDEVGFDAIEAMKLLSEKGIGSRPFFYPMHLQPIFKKKNLFSGEQYPVSERIAERGFYLPSGLALTENQIVEVANTVKSIFS
jgi:perosamine synthetase